MLKLFTAGNRTITLSVMGLIMAMLLQADSQGIFTLAPMLKIVITMGMTLIVPLVPIFIRKAIGNKVK